MKKKISILFSVLMVFGLLLTACQTQATEPAATEPEVVAPAPTEPEVVEPAPTEPAPEGKPILVVSLPALDNPLMLAFQDAFK